MLPALSLGEQFLTNIRRKNQIYVDKTQRIYELIHYSSYIFLSRPRRFGKSLLVSTLEALFEGKKELFEDTWIADKWNWKLTYPVLRIDFSKVIATGGLEKLNEGILFILEDYAELYDVQIRTTDARYYLDRLITKIYRKTNQPLVILIDEYDSPITSNLSNPDKAEAVRDWLREFYVKFKAQGNHLHFFFMTGISKFAKMSIFSALSNLKDISLLEQFNDVVGFTLQEILLNFQPHLKALSQKEQLSTEGLLNQLAHWYNGYSWGGTRGVYNPYCLLNVFRDLKFAHYWFETATPYFLVELIRHQYPFPHHKPPVLEDFVQVVATQDVFDSYDLRDIDLTTLLFQTGYLTILNIEKTGVGQYRYTLGYPNFEVRWSFNSYLLALFTTQSVGKQIKIKATALKEALETADFETFFTIVQSFFASIPYHLLKQYTEHTYQSLFYMLLTMLGVEIEELNLEKPSHHGRADGILVLENIIYIIEFKFARKGKLSTLVQKAMTQILDKGYHLPYMSGTKTIYQLGVAFLSKKQKQEDTTVLLIDYDKKRLN